MVAIIISPSCLGEKEVIQLLHDPIGIITDCSRLKQQLRHLNVNTRTDENERITSDGLSHSLYLGILPEVCNCKKRG